MIARNPATKKVNAAPYACLNWEPTREKITILLRKIRFCPDCLDYLRNRTMLV